MTVRTLGAGGVVAATIAGQLALSVVVDHFGLLGVDQAADHAARRCVGVVLLGLGTYLVVRESRPSGRAVAAGSRSPCASPRRAGRRARALSTYSGGQMSR